MHGGRKPPGPKKEERLNDGNNNGQLRIATPPRGAQKATWANVNLSLFHPLQRRHECHVSECTNV